MQELQKIKKERMAEEARMVILYFLVYFNLFDKCMNTIVS